MHDTRRDAATDTDRATDGATATKGGRPTAEAPRPPRAERTPRTARTPQCPPFAGFSAALFTFLRELEEHNERAFMDANRERFEEQVRAPSLAFVRAVAPRIASVCPRLVASDARAGGAMLRINRDTRFSASKRPYHTSVILRFPHADSEPRWAPGCTLRLTSRAVTLSAGLRVPGAHTLRVIRTAIDADQEAWAAVRRARGFRSAFGDLTPPELVRVPAGWSAEHAFAADLRRKHFIAAHELTPEDAAAGTFPGTALRIWRAATPLLHFLCAATSLAWEPRTSARGTP